MSYNVAAWWSTIFCCWNGWEWQNIRVPWLLLHWSSYVEILKNFKIFFFFQRTRIIFWNIERILLFKMGSWKLFNYSTDMCWSCTCTTLTRHNIAAHLLYIPCLSLSRILHKNMVILWGKIEHFLMTWRIRSVLELRSLLKVFGYYAILGITNKASHYKLVFGHEIMPKSAFSSFFHVFRVVTPSMFFVDFLKKFIKKAALLGCWTGLMRFRVHDLASHQIAVGLPKTHLLS